MICLIVTTLYAINKLKLVSIILVNQTFRIVVRTSNMCRNIIKKLIFKQKKTLSALAGSITNEKYNIITLQNDLNATRETRIMTL